MKAGTGFSNNKNAHDAGVEVAHKALHNSGIDHPSLALAFCDHEADHEAFFSGLASQLNSTPIIGGSAIGIVTSDNLNYTDHPSGVLLLENESAEMTIASCETLHKGEYNAGVEIAETLKPVTHSGPILLFYNSIRSPMTSASPPILNASTPLIDGIINTIGSNSDIFGAGLLGDYKFNNVQIFCGNHVGEQCAVAAVCSKSCEHRWCIMHGLTPLDGVYHTITRKAGDIIFEIDGKPVVKMIDEIYGHSNWHNQHPLNLLAIGLNYGKRYGIPKESQYVNRIITGVLPDKSGISLFEPDLNEGDEIQFMLRDTTEMIRSAHNNTAEILKSVYSEGKKAVCGLYIDCAGRTALDSHSSTEEAAEVQTLFRQYNVPLFGFYSGVEIAPMLGKSRGLDLTGVLIVYVENKETKTND